MADMNAQMQQPNAQMYAGNDTQMHPGTSGQMMQGGNPQAMSPANPQMYSGTNVIPGTPAPGQMPNAQMMPGTAADAQAMYSSNTNLNCQQYPQQGMQMTNSQPQMLPNNSSAIQCHQESNQDLEPLMQVNSTYTPVGKRSKSSQILGVGCRLLWLLYLLSAGLYLIADGFREITKIKFHAGGVTMILVGVAFLVVGFYLAYKSIGRHCIPVVAVQQDS